MRKLSTWLLLLLCLSSSLAFAVVEVRLGESAETDGLEEYLSETPGRLVYLDPLPFLTIEHVKSARKLINEDGSLVLALGLSKKGKSVITSVSGSNRGRMIISMVNDKVLHSVRIRGVTNGFSLRIPITAGEEALDLYVRDINLAISRYAKEKPSLLTKLWQDYPAVIIATLLFGMTYKTFTSKSNDPDSSSRINGDEYSQVLKESGITVGPPFRVLLVRFVLVGMLAAFCYSSWLNFSGNNSRHAYRTFPKEYIEPGLMRYYDKRWKGRYKMVEIKGLVFAPVNEHLFDVHVYYRFQKKGRTDTGSDNRVFRAVIEEIDYDNASVTIVDMGSHGSANFVIAYGRQYLEKFFW